MARGSRWRWVRGGRPTTVTQTIGAAPYVTAYAYDAADRPITTTYPTGEVITNSYNAAGLPLGLRSQTNSQWYAQATAYNANGSLSRLDLGNGVTTKYGYFGLLGTWDNRPAAGNQLWGRLWRIRTEAANGQPLMDLRYAYDNVGNPSVIVDAPRDVTGTPTVTLSDPFNSTNAWWTYDGYQTVPYSLGGGNVLKNGFTGINWDADVVRADYALTSGGGARVSFQVTSTAAVFVLAMETSSSPYYRLALYGHDGGLNVQYYDSTAWREPTTIITPLVANTWYTLTLATDNLRGQTLEVISGTTHSAYNISMVGNKSWQFHAWSYTGTLYLDDYQEFSALSTPAYDPDEREKFTYDALDRLTQAQKDGTTGGYDESYAYNAIGNLTSKGGVGYTYGDAAHKHAVTAMGGNSYTYDANGNMLTRPSQTLTWDAENRLASVTQGGTTTAFTYDGDGNRVRVAVGNVVTVYVGSLYEVNATSGVTTTYYYFGSQRVAMRTAAGATYLAGDHLGSASLAMGASNTSQRYYPYGGTRSGGVPTDYQFTGQKLDTGTSLYYYGARYYDPVTGRFVSADTVVPSPGKPQALNRYSYVYDNPVKYTDPTGHRVCGDPDTESCESSGTRFETFRNTPPDDIPSSPAGGDPATPWQVGLEWLTGRGQREHQFRAGDPFTALLRKHEHVEDVRNEVRRIISRRLDHSQPWRLDYSLGGLEGVPKYFRDYSTLLTGGLTGNLAVTYLGSYELELFVLNVDRNNGTITTLFNVHNESNLASATHPPVLGYTWLWEQTIGSWANGLRTSGPLSPTRQEFWWSETFGWK